MNFVHEPKMKYLVVMVFLLLGKTSSPGFSLIGPYANWMYETNGFRQKGDIGGPMEIGQGYRWNVPAVTYAFDKSFVDFFGSNGVAAVEGAIAILNELPPASDIILTNFPLAAALENHNASVMQLYDLKSAALAYVLEHLGLGSPIRNIFDLRQWDPVFLTAPYENSWPEGTIPKLIIERNFDPDSLTASHYVNGELYSGKVVEYWPASNAIELRVDLDSNDPRAVADNPYWQINGTFWSGLSRDDAGGLRYLLSSNTISLETLLPDVHGAGTNASNFVNLARRPGVEKINFVPHQFDPSSGLAIPFTNQFVDTYFMNHVARHQLLERVVSQPDFLFSFADLGDSLSVDCARSGATNWWNSATAWGNTNQIGPGVIRPPVKITFDPQGPAVFDSNNSFGYIEVVANRWGSYGASVADPIAYPTGVGTNGVKGLNVHLWLWYGFQETHLDWRLPVPLGATASLQTSTNLMNWASVATITNLTGTLSWRDAGTQRSKFFRVVPQ
jgi:hypothetical protein